MPILVMREEHRRWRHVPGQTHAPILPLGGQVGRLWRVGYGHGSTVHLVITEETVLTGPGVVQVGVPAGGGVLDGAAIQFQFIGVDPDPIVVPVGHQHGVFKHQRGGAGTSGVQEVSVGCRVIPVADPHHQPGHASGRVDDHL